MRRLSAGREHAEVLGRRLIESFEKRGADAASSQRLTQLVGGPLHRNLPGHIVGGVQDNGKTGVRCSCRKRNELRPGSRGGDRASLLEEATSAYALIQWPGSLVEHGTIEGDWEGLGEEEFQ